MKMKILVKIIEKLFGVLPDGEHSKKDMYLPDRLLAISFVFLAAGGVCAIVLIFKFAVWAAVFAPIGIVFGAFAFLCWKNQSIEVISDDEFVYTTMFGKKHTYSFSDIRMLRRNNDSMTLFVADKKVHIESMAVLSDRLIERINYSLEKIYNQD